MPAPIYRFSTIDFPAKERFDAWRADSSPLFEFLPPETATVIYDSKVAVARLGDMIFGEANWLRPEQKAHQGIRRNLRKIRNDNLDHYYLRLQRDAEFHIQSSEPTRMVNAGSFCLLDMASPFELKITTGNSIFAIVPRELLPTNVATLHGRSVTGGMGIFLSDYFNSLSRNFDNLAHEDTLHVRHATLNMLRACLTPTPDTLMQVNSELHTILRNRVASYIEKNLLNCDLNTGLICRDIGISRSKLYRLFEESGGIARQIQRKRLLKIRSILEDPFAPRARIAEVAWRHGFTNEKRFSRAYKTEFGHTPSEAVSARGRQAMPHGPHEAPLNRPIRSFREWMHSLR